MNPQRPALIAASQRVALCLAALLPIAATAADSHHETVSRGSDREATAITVYNDDLALVKERRKVTLPAGMAKLALRDVAAQMRPETALLSATSGAPIALVEQNFDFDLLTPAKLIEKFVGKEVTVIRSNPATGEERSEKARVLSTNSGVVLRFADRIETGIPGRLAFDQVPENLRDRPTLSVLLEGKGGRQTLELSYLTGGLSWKADYVANLAGDDQSLDLSGWVTLTNRSGAAYEEATLQLVAGTVNRVREAVEYARAPRMAMLAKAATAEVVEETLGDVHLYSFERPTTIADNQTKQLALLSAAGVPVQREYLIAGSDYHYRNDFSAVAQKIKPAVFIKFKNRGGQLGKPLPAGVVRVYARDSRGAAQFVGEDRIDHTPKNEEVSLRLGEAFDVTAERKQTLFRRLTEKNAQGLRVEGAEVGYRIEIRNAKEQAVTVRVQEAIGGDWTMAAESAPHSRESAQVAVWNVPVPADGKTVLDYRIKVRW